MRSEKGRNYKLINYNFYAQYDKWENDDGDEKHGDGWKDDGWENDDGNEECNDGGVKSGHDDEREGDERNANHGSHEKDVQHDDGQRHDDGNDGYVKQTKSHFKILSGFLFALVVYYLTKSRQ